MQPDLQKGVLQPFHISKFDESYVSANVFNLLSKKFHPKILLFDVSAILASQAMDCQIHTCNWKGYKTPFTDPVTYTVSYHYIPFKLGLK